MFTIFNADRQKKAGAFCSLLANRKFQWHLLDDSYMVATKYCPCPFDNFYKPRLIFNRSENFFDIQYSQSRPLTWVYALRVSKHCIEICKIYCRCTYIAYLITNILDYRGIYNFVHNYVRWDFFETWFHNDISLCASLHTL